MSSTYSLVQCPNLVDPSIGAAICSRYNGEHLHAVYSFERQCAHLVQFGIFAVDGDGVVTLSEHDAFTEHVFLEADADDDGYLTFQELKQHNRGM